MSGHGFVRPEWALDYGPQGPAWVYRHVDETGRTLYIGYSTQPELRQPTHRRSSQWFPLVAEIVYHGPLSVPDAVNLERQLIAAEDPPFNAQGTPRGRGKLPPARTADVEAWIAAQQQATSRGGES